MSETLFRPESGGRPDTVVVSYYPLMGNDYNTGPRYAREAELTGFDIIGITRDGSNTATYDRSLRKDLSPKNFDEKWQEHAANLDSMTRDYDKIIVRGQSTGSFPAMNVVRNGLVRATHYLAEDGVNTRVNWFGKQRSPLTARYDWALGLVREKRAKPQPLMPEWQKPPAQPGEPDALRKFRIEVKHWGPLWQSSYSRDTALEIAEDMPKLPMLFIFLGHTATSTRKKLTGLLIS